MKPEKPKSIQEIIDELEEDLEYSETQNEQIAITDTMNNLKDVQKEIGKIDKEQIQEWWKEFYAIPDFKLFPLWIIQNKIHGNYKEKNDKGKD